MFFAGKQIEYCLSLFYIWAAFCFFKMQQVSEILVSETCCIGALFAHLLIWKGKVGRSGGETTKAGRAKLYAKLNAKDIVAMEVNSLAFVMEKEMRQIGCTVVILDASQLSIIYASTKKTDKEDALKLARLVKIYEKECLFSAAEMARSSTDEHPCPSVDGEFWQSQNIASVL